MRYQERRLNYLNHIANKVGNLWSEAFESLIDGDYDDVRDNLHEIKSVIDDLTKSISNEI
jgi:phosphate uptake regulator